MKKTVISLAIIAISLVACGCSTTSTCQPKGAIPYLMNGGDARYTSQHVAEYPNGIIMLEFEF